MKKHQWLESERDIVRRDYDGTNQSALMIASKLGVTLCAVKGQVQVLGISQQKSPPWSESEIEKLSELIHAYSITTIAKMLHRSINSVKIKATRLKLGLRVRDRWFTKKDVCEILGVGHKKVQGYIDRGELKASWHTERKPQKNGMAMWHIKTGDLREFIERNASDFQGRNVDLATVVWLLNGGIE